MENNYSIVTFGGREVNLPSKHYAVLSTQLKKTGKFIEIDGELINISEIKAVKKVYREKKMNDLSKLF